MAAAEAAAAALSSGISGHELSIEEKAAKVRAEIKRRRARLGDAGRGNLYRHYSLDDYNLDSYASDYSATDPLLGDPLHGQTDLRSAEGYDLAVSSDLYPSSRSHTHPREYSLSSATKEKYYSDE